MQNSTGEILTNKEMKELMAGGAPCSDFQPIKIPITPHQNLTRVIGPYDPCGCGSGKKFKFCCRVKPERPFVRDVDRAIYLNAK